MRKKHLAMAAVNLVAGSTAIFAQPVMSAPDPNSAQLFANQCASCHSTVAGEVRVGPSLSGIAGRKAGALPGYPYSDALRGKGAGGLVWNDEALDAWLADSGAYIPGSMMNFRQADPVKRAAIIRYIAELK